MPRGISCRRTGANPGRREMDHLQPKARIEGDCGKIANSGRASNGRETSQLSPQEHPCSRASSERRDAPFAKVRICRALPGKADKKNRRPLVHPAPPKSKAWD